MIGFPLSVAALLISFVALYLATWSYMTVRQINNARDQTIRTLGNVMLLIAQGTYPDHVPCPICDQPVNAPHVPVCPIGRVLDRRGPNV